MSNVVTFPEQAPTLTPEARYAEIAVYGTVGPLTVALARRTDTSEGLIHIVVMGSAIGLEMVATLPDDDKGRAVADFTGPAVLRAVELSETEFAARPEAC
jgi:urea transporter